MSVSEQLSRFVAETSFRALPAEAVARAKGAILDTIGVTLAGCREEAATIVALRAQKSSASGEASVLGWSLRLSAESAALVNGVSAHALDYDDVSYSMRGHPSAPLLPAVLAVGEVAGAGGREMIAAFVAGLEVEAKLGAVLGARHYALGWHATSTLGPLGAVAAGAKLLGLDAPRIGAALGVASSMAGGLRANFGTMTKPLHAGLAARSGVEAALLASAGFTASADAIGGESGFLAAFLAQPPAEDIRLDNLGDPFEIVSPGLAQKLYPCCYATHRAVDAALELAPGIDAGLIESIEVTVSRGSLMPLITDRLPDTGLEGKFSLQYCVAAALAQGRLGMPAFTDTAVRRQQVIALAEQVDVREDQQSLSNPLDSWAEVTVRLRDGQTLARRVDAPKGDPRRPLTWDEIADKFRDCASLILEPEEAARVVEICANLEELQNVGELTARLSKVRQLTV